MCGLPNRSGGEDEGRAPGGGVERTEPGARSEAAPAATVAILGRLWVVKIFNLIPGDPQDDRRHMALLGLLG